MHFWEVCGFPLVHNVIHIIEKLYETNYRWIRSKRFYLECRGYYILVFWLQNEDNMLKYGYKEKNEKKIPGSSDGSCCLIVQTVI